MESIIECSVCVGSGSEDSNEEAIPPLFDKEYDLYDSSLPAEVEPSSPPELPPPLLPSLQTAPTTPAQSCRPTISTPSSSSLATSHSLSQMLSLSDTPTISTACRRQDLIPDHSKKRPRKPSPLRQSRPSSQDQLNEFLMRGCRCKSKCYLQFDREYYGNKRDEASALT